MTTEETIRATIQQVQNDTLYDGRYTEEDRLVEAVKVLVEGARKDALLEAAKANCGYCRHGDKPVFKVRWHHADSNGVPFGGCTSNRIYELLAIDERTNCQDQGEGVQK